VFCTCQEIGWEGRLCCVERVAELNSAQPVDELNSYVCTVAASVKFTSGGTSGVAEEDSRC